MDSSPPSTTAKVNTVYKSLGQSIARRDVEREVSSWSRRRCRRCCCSLRSAPHASPAGDCRNGSRPRVASYPRWFAVRNFEATEAALCLLTSTALFMATIAGNDSVFETAFTVLVNFEPSCCASDVLTIGATFWKPVTCAFGSS